MGKAHASIVSSSTVPAAATVRHPTAFESSAQALPGTSETSFRVIDASKAIEKYYVATTILNSKGKQHATLSVFYSKLNKVKYIKGRVYNALGAEVTSLKPKNIEDYSTYSSESLFDDNRVKIAQLALYEYP